MKFLCDQMLVRLGRWLRAAGYDTEIIEIPRKDQDIFRQAQEQQRLLITRDKHFLDIKGTEGILLWLKSNRLEDCIKELGKLVKIDWNLQPFSRCLLCNNLLVNANEVSLSEVPPLVLQHYQQFWFCSKCEKVYWMGSHTHHMINQMKIWQGTN